MCPSIFNKIYQFMTLLVCFPTNKINFHILSKKWEISAIFKITVYSLPIICKQSIYSKLFAENKNDIRAHNNTSKINILHLHSWSYEIDSNFVEIFKGKVIIRKIWKISSKAELNYSAYQFEWIYVLEEHTVNFFFSPQMIFSCLTTPYLQAYSAQNLIQIDLCINTWMLTSLLSLLC